MFSLTPFKYFFYFPKRTLVIFNYEIRELVKMKALITYTNIRATITAEVRPRKPLRVIPEDGGGA